MSRVFEITLKFYNHEESSSMWFVVYEKIENYEFFKHDQGMLKDVTFCVPKSSLPNSLIREAHDESVMLHGFSFGIYMEYETLKCFVRCIMHKRDKFKDVVHGMKMSLLVHNFHWVRLAMKFVLKCPRSKRGKHFHLILYGCFLVLVFDTGGWIGKHINNKRFTLFKEFKSP